VSHTLTQLHGANLSLESGSQLTYESSSVESPIRANQASKLDHVPRSLNPVTLRRFPFQACVEDEADALRRELDSTDLSISWDEEPKYRGDKEQEPILIPVENHGHFILVSQQSPVTDDDPYLYEAEDPFTLEMPEEKEAYEANTRRKYLGGRDDDSALSPQHPEIPRSRSRLGLPRIQTDVTPERPYSRSRPRSATYLDQRTQDYFESQESERPPGDGLLSPPPRIVKHGTGTRDKTYHGFGSGGRQDGVRSVSNNDRRSDDRQYERASLSAAPQSHRRSFSSTSGVPKMSRQSSVKYSRRNEPPSPRTGKRSNSPPELNRSRSSFTRMDQLPPSPPPDEEKLRRRSSTYRRRDSSYRKDEDDCENEQSKSSRRRGDRRKSVIYQEGSLLTPDTSRPRGLSMSKSRPTTPLASPGLPAAELSPIKRSATTFEPPRERRRDSRAVSPFSSGDSNSPTRSRLRDEEQSAVPQGRSRAWSFVSATSVASATSGTLPIPIPRSGDEPRDRRGIEVPQSLRSRDSLEYSPPCASGQPQSLDSQRSGGESGYPATSLRRYSEDTSLGRVQRFPTCQRQTLQSGHRDWRTLPSFDRFNICPGCYDAVFANTPYANQLVPAKYRPLDKMIACDIGSTHWYQIAWYLTAKHQLRDLRLLEAIADVADRYRPCRGAKRVTRLWYSVEDVTSGKRSPAAPDFEVCHSCSKAVAALFPNFKDTFRPVDGRRKESSGVCALHYFPERKRFLDYLDLFEAEFDKSRSFAAADASAGTEAFVSQLQRLSTRPECPRDRFADGRKFYQMVGCPELTVCEECFEEVVYPEVERRNPVTLAFPRRPKELKSGMCTLYSPRMRAMFRQACDDGRSAVLEEEAVKRWNVHKRIFVSLEKYEDKKLPSEEDGREVRMLLKEWEMCE
jgi:hypothetical protein